MADSRIIFKPHFVQKGQGPHLLDFAYVVDREGDVFRTDVSVTREGVTISDSGDHERFAVHVRWNVEGYGYLYYPLDHGGELYQMPNSGTRIYHLNFELAFSRVRRNQRRLHKLSSEHWAPSNELRLLMDISEDYLHRAETHMNDDLICARHSQTALQYALWASDLMEAEHAGHLVEHSTPRKAFFFGCDARARFKMDADLFFERFTGVFNYATITHYLIGDIFNFEEKEGEKQFKERDRVLEELLKHNIAVEGRPLFWVHTWVTPDWLKKKSYSQTLTYLEKHIREVIGHYGNDIIIWEVVNELHDWANELELDHQQTIELTKFACDVARDTNPNVRLLINNCCPFAEYVQKKKWHERPAKYPQRTPRRFVQDLIEAEVDFDIIGTQVYFVHRSMADAIGMIERFGEFNKPVHLAEVGATSHGITQEFNMPEEDWSQLPYEWHRHWDEELQADWLEAIFTYAYSRPWIEAANWYDFVDPHGFLKKGGLLRSTKGEKKAAYERLVTLQKTLFRG
jgi:GH35 family endo-1,4-beta-xylanase